MIRANKLRANLFKAVEDDDLILLSATMKLITDFKQKVTDKVYRQANTDLTVLAYAINLNRDRLIDTIMKTEGKDIIFEQYNYNKQQLIADPIYSQWADQSFLTCIHLLAARGKNETVRLFIRLVPLKTDEDFKQLQTYLSHLAYQDIGRQYTVGVSTKRLVSALHIAVATENLELIDILLKQGIDPDIMNGKDFCHASPLALAVENDNLEAFRRLADISKTFKGPSKSELIRRFLQIASAAGSLKIVEELLKLADANHLIHTENLQDTIDESSVEAIRNGYMKIYELLLQNLDPTKLKRGLLEAIKRDNKEIVENLLDKGAPVTDSADNCETSPLSVCVKQEKADILPLLLQKADHINEDFWKGVAAARDEFSRLAIECYRKSKHNEKGRLTFTTNSTTAMHIAASLDKLDTLLALVGLGARKDLVDENGDLIMHTAAKNGALKVLSETLDYFNPNLQNNAGETALLLACKYSRPKVIELIASRGKNIDWQIKNADGDTVLHLAVKQLSATNKRAEERAGVLNGPLPTREERSETLQLVIQYCTEAFILNEIDSDGNVALNLIIQMRRETEVPLFSAADPTIPNKRGNSAIDVAMDIYEEQPGLIEVLLKTFPIKVAIYLAKEYRHKNYPPLHQFAKRRDIENIKLLVQHGASVLEQNEDGQTIFHALVKLAVQNEANEAVYITISQTIIDILVEFRIQRQQAVYKLMAKNSLNVISDSKNYENATIKNCKTNSNDNINIPLLEETKTNFHQDLFSSSFEDDNYFVTQKHIKSYDIRRIIFVYLTRIAKNREKQTVLNYAIHIKAKNFIEYLLDAKEISESQSNMSSAANHHGQVSSKENEDDKDYVSDGYLKNGEHEQEDKMVKTISYLYDVTCLTPETMSTFGLLNSEWIEDALSEKYLYQVLVELRNKTNQHKKLTDVIDSHTSEVESINMLDKMAQNWGLHDLYSSLEKQNDIEVKQTDKTKEKIKKHRKKKALKELSALDTIVNMSDEVVASELLNKIPLTQLVESYWSIYRWIYFVIMIVHIIYMWIFSSAAIDTALLFAASGESDGQATADSSEGNKAIVKRQLESDGDTNFESLNNITSTADTPTVSEIAESFHYHFILLLFYPLAMLILTCYFEAIRIISWYNLQRAQPKQKFRDRISSALAGILDWPYRAISFAIECLTTISCLMFTICMLIWYVKLVQRDWYRNYYLSICLIFGWLLTINYTRGFQTLHSFKNIMKSIVMSDMLRFFMVYIFILIGFSLGFHALLGYIDGALEKQPTPADSVFFNLRNFLSPADIFEFDDFKAFDKTGGGIYVKVAYLIFSFLLGLILINILIAMMNDSYIRVNEMEQITFRLGSLRQALVMFRCFPIIIRLKERLMRGNRSQVVQSQLVPQRAICFFTLFCQVQVGGDQPLPTVEERLDHIERDVKIVHENIQGLSKEMQAINVMQESMLDLSRQIQDIRGSREDTKVLLSAIMAKLEECTFAVKILTENKAAATN